ncbi:hypothetical protein B0T18DRAFT_216633 [Schizothecium vesticola]|uniref:Uncharacterized protein n=1 Tax=Schizothecium vesticola TaxID=314040 RepID=A0AA40EK12_9PEZI|nr:hypothetical protein B0T18DRAFT_216633 [Schizothecium vesticola]
MMCRARLYLTIGGLHEHKAWTSPHAGSQTPRLWFVHRAHLLIPAPCSASRQHQPGSISWIHGMVRALTVESPKSSPDIFTHRSAAAFSSQSAIAVGVVRHWSEKNPAPSRHSEFARLITCPAQSRDGSIATMPKTPDTTSSAIPPGRTIANPLPGSIGTGQERDLCNCVTPPSLAWIRTTFRILHEPRGGVLGTKWRDPLFIDSRDAESCVESFQKVNNNPIVLRH